MTQLNTPIFGLAYVHFVHALTVGLLPLTDNAKHFYYLYMYAYKLTINAAPAQGVKVQFTNCL